MSRIPLGPLGGNSLGDYLREQRQSAKLSLRQLAELAGVSNPYLSQIERGLKRPSAEILQQLARGLQVSAESLYVHAGILDERRDVGAGSPGTRAAIAADPRLTDRQKAALLDIYDSFVAAEATTSRATSRVTTARTTTPRTTAPRTTTAPTTPRTTPKTPSKGE